MKIKLLIVLILLAIVNLKGMEVPDLSVIIKGAVSEEFEQAWNMVSGSSRDIPSLKAIAAQKILDSKITIDKSKIPEEVEQFISNIEKFVKQINAIVINFIDFRNFDFS